MGMYVQFHWCLTGVTLKVDEEELIELCIDQWISVREKSFANSILEFYKQQTKKGTQKAKALRKQYNSRIMSNEIIYIVQLCLCVTTIVFYKEALLSLVLSLRKTFRILNGLLNTGAFPAISMCILGVIVLYKLVYGWVIIGGSRLVLHTKILFKRVLTDLIA